MGNSMCSCKEKRHRHNMSIEEYQLEKVSKSITSRQISTIESQISCHTFHSNTMRPVAHRQMSNANPRSMKSSRSFHTDSDIEEKEEEIKNLGEYKKLLGTAKFKTMQFDNMLLNIPKCFLTNDPRRFSSIDRGHQKDGAQRFSKSKIIIDCSLFRGERKNGKINDFYEILEPAGKGSYASVYKCRHFITSDIRAVKVVSKKLLMPGINPMSEFEILKKLDHPNIIRFYEYFQDETNYYLVTEFCHGGELFDHLIRQRQFTEGKAAIIMQQLLSVVSYCHAHNVIHRDLKPENLLMESYLEDGIIKVIDFGGSKIFQKNNSKKIHESFGTPYYIAPEVLSKNHDEKCDIWSCGVILYALLWGKPPFNAKSHNSVLKAVQTGKYSLEDPDGTEISNEAKNLITLMLEYDPNKRISAKEASCHQWVLSRAALSDGIFAETALLTFSNLRSFATKQKFAEAVLTYLVTQMQTKSEELKLRKTFQAFDANKDGQLSRDELINGYTIIFEDKQMAIIEVDRIMNNVDINHNGLIDYTEFIMANTNLNSLMGDRQIRAAFEQFDLDGNGQITIDELREVMGAGLETDNEDKFFAELIAEVDQDGDGQINYDEFKNMMKNFSARRLTLC